MCASRVIGDSKLQMVDRQADVTRDDDKTFKEINAISAFYALYAFCAFYAISALQSRTAVVVVEQFFEIGAESKVEGRRGECRVRASGLQARGGGKEGAAELFTSLRPRIRLRTRLRRDRRRYPQSGAIQRVCCVNKTQESYKNYDNLDNLDNLSFEI